MQSGPGVEAVAEEACAQGGHGLRAVSEPAHASSFHTLLNQCLGCGFDGTAPLLMGKPALRQAAQFMRRRFFHR